MSPEHARELADRRIVRVTPTADPRRWRIETGSKVGVIAGDDWVLRIAPKLNVPHLLFLLGYSVRPQGWKQLLASFDDTSDLVGAVANGFSWHLEEALREGPVYG